MSWFESSQMTCGRCGHGFDGHSADSINVVRMPQARQQILDGDFHRVPCPSCGARIEIDRSFLYTDVSRRQFAQVFPLDHARQWSQWESMAEEVFAGGFETGPAGVQSLGADFTVRALFGLDALAEKLRLWDAGLDDALVELLKLELVACWPELHRPDPGLLVVEIEPRQLVVTATAEPDGGERPLYGLNRARYDELQAERTELEANFPGLFFKPFVDYRRLASERVSA
jgi:CpXC protein